jgi:hypothetical protein
MVFVVHCVWLLEWIHGLCCCSLFVVTRTDPWSLLLFIVCGYYNGFMVFVVHCVWLLELTQDLCCPLCVATRMDPWSMLFTVATRMGPVDDFCYFLPIKASTV